MHEFPQEHPGVKNCVNLLVTLSKTRSVPARSSHTTSSSGAVSGRDWCRRSVCCAGRWLLHGNNLNFLPVMWTITGGEKSCPTNQLLSKD